jgi:hypothetical protein
MVTHWRGSEGKLANGVGSQYSCTTSEHGVSSITTADAHAPADLNGLVCFSERRNLVYARALSHFKHSPPADLLTSSVCWCNVVVENPTEADRLEDLRIDGILKKKGYHGAD